MQKRVHFAPTNTVFSTSRSPSPALSDTSHPSDDSSEISTPPPEPEYAQEPRSHLSHPAPNAQDLAILHPNHFQPSPPQFFYQHHELVPKPQVTTIPESGHMHVHYLLAYNPGVEIPIFFDLSRPTKQVFGQLEPHEYHEAATSPPLQSLIISCPTLVWEIVVTPIVSSHTPTSSPSEDDFYPSPSSSLQQQQQHPRPDYVTVNDVLYHLFRQLRSPVTRDEYGSLATGPTKQAVNSAYRMRCARIVDPRYREREEGKGVKRVDFLQETCIFKGLSWTSTDARVWELNVGAPPHGQASQAITPVVGMAYTASVA